MAFEMSSPARDSVQCPVCFKDFTPVAINAHLDACLLKSVTDSNPSTAAENGPPDKKCRVGVGPVNKPVSGCSSSSSSTDGPQSAAVFSLFHTNKGKLSVQSEPSSALPQKRSPVAAPGKGLKRGLMEADFEPAAAAVEAKQSQEPTSLTHRRTTDQSSSRTTFTFDKPLAESLRPSTLEDYFGQSKVVGQQTLIRSLLDSQEIPSLILWGPPGCGKVCTWQRQ